MIDSAGGENSDAHPWKSCDVLLSDLPQGVVDLYCLQKTEMWLSQFRELRQALLGGNRTESSAQTLSKMLWIDRAVHLR
jgi:hypothetical protein